MNFELLDVILFFGLFLGWGISLLLFNRLSVAKIDKRMAEDGLAKECPIDIFGTRALFISDALALSYISINTKKYPFVNVKLINEYATEFDRRLALVLSIFQYSFLMYILISCVFY
ncbi:MULTISPECIES: hypothetical protein [Thalassolituus]|jgi:hypothetical protein|uniref:hypothetical protein n=1 Tax=Thalassolituus TaxID=187492 RepID=UPI0023F54013|nr:hypothetical protein [Thalassolituus oleivorans]